MRQSIANTTSTQHRPEYSVYVYHYASDIEEGHTDWEKMRVTRNKYRAMRLAEKLHGSADYKKVEVKRKAFDERYARPVDRTVRVFNSTAKVSRESLLLKLPKILRKLI